MTESAYIPGMCNINNAEIAYRRKAMWFGILLSAALMVVLFMLHAEWWIGVPVLFIPVFIGVIGYLQVTNKFCVSYGSSGKQNADDTSESAHDVIDSEARKADKAKTRKMNIQATGITAIVLLLSGVVLYVA